MDTKPDIYYIALQANEIVVIIFSALLYVSVYAIFEPRCSARNMSVFMWYHFTSYKNISIILQSQ